MLVTLVIDEMMTADRRLAKEQVKTVVADEMKTLDKIIEDNEAKLRSVWVIMPDIGIFLKNLSTSSNLILNSHPWQLSQIVKIHCRHFLKDWELIYHLDTTLQE